MKCWSILLIALVVGVLIPGAGSTGSLSDEPRVYTYEEAKAAGIRVPTLVERVCEARDFNEGFTSAEALAESLADYERRWGEQGPEYCQLDPREAMIAVMPPKVPVEESPPTIDLRGMVEGPSSFLEEEEESEGGGEGGEESGESDVAPSCYAGPFAHRRYVGVLHCIVDAEGIRATIEVGDPNLCHSNCGVAKHLYARAEVQTGGGNGAEVGWIEATWLPNGHWPAAAFNNNLTAHGPANLAANQVVEFRLRHVGPGGPPGSVRAEYYDGGWKLIDDYTSIWCMDADGDNNCGGGVMNEVLSNNDAWFNMNAPNFGAKASTTATFSSATLQTLGCSSRRSG